MDEDGRTVDVDIQERRKLVAHSNLENVKLQGDNRINIINGNMTSYC